MATANRLHEHLSMRSNVMTEMAISATAYQQQKVTETKQ